MKQQQPKEQVQVETMGREQAEQSAVRVPRLHIETLEERVAPNAIWGE